MQRSLVVLAAVVLSTCALTACGSSGDETEPSPSRGRTSRTTSEAVAPTSVPVAPANLCDVLPQDEVEVAFGEPVIAGEQSRDECWWSTPNDLKTVNVIRRADDLATWRSGYDNDFWVPNNFGDEGYTGTALDSIVWRIGDTEYEVNVVFSTKGDPEQVVQTLAEKVAARL